MTDNAQPAAKTSKEPSMTTVTMADGTIRDFPGKSRILTNSYAADDGSLCVRLDFINGEVRVFKMRNDMVERFALHGAVQKLRDETAGLKDIGDAVLAVEELIDRLTAGEWNVKRASGESMAGTSILARALVEVMSKPMETIRNFLKTKTQAEKMALRNNPRIKPTIDRLENEKFERSAVKVDTEALLAGLGD